MTWLDLDDNQIVDIAPLAELTNLTYLDLCGQLYYNQENYEYVYLSDISPLAGLTNLTELWFSDNQITDAASLAGLTNLTKLKLSFQRCYDKENNGYIYALSDISPLAGLTNLTELDLGYNKIADISSLSGLTNLAKGKNGSRMYKSIRQTAGGVFQEIGAQSERKIHRWIV